MADEDEQEPDEPAPEDTEAGVGGTKTWSERVRGNFGAQRFLRPRASSTRRPGGADSGRHGLSTTTSDEARAAVNSLDPRERRIAITATIFELALTLIVVVPYLTHKNNRSTSDLKTLGAVHVFLFEGIVLFIFLLLGTFLRRRALFGFASLLVGFWLLQIKALSVLGIAYVGLGMWLIMKGLKSTRGQGQGAARKPAAQPRPRRSRKGDKVPASRAAAKAQQALHATKGAPPTCAEEACARSRRDPEALIAAKAATVPATAGQPASPSSPNRFRS